MAGTWPYVARTTTPLCSVGWGNEGRRVDLGTFKATRSTRTMSLTAAKHVFAHTHMLALQ
eukprot:12930173-Prorocentrum_lima.AAC.1